MSKHNRWDPKIDEMLKEGISAEEIQKEYAKRKGHFHLTLREREAVNEARIRDVHATKYFQRKDRKDLSTSTRKFVGASFRRVITRYVSPKREYQFHYTKGYRSYRRPPDAVKP